MSKVFRYFLKMISHMKSSLVVIIGTGIVIISIILAVILMQTQETDIAEVEDTLDKEILPIESNDPIIQDAYDEISQNKLDGVYSPLQPKCTRYMILRSNLFPANMQIYNRQTYLKFMFFIKVKYYKQW